MREPPCFNANCHTTVYQNVKADQLLPHVKECFLRGGVGLVSCGKCLEAFTEGLKAKDTTYPPDTVCQICAGVNGSVVDIQLFANGEFSLWICDKCQHMQRSVINTNFYLPQKLVPPKKTIELFTFNLPKDPPKKRIVSPVPARALSPPKRKLPRPSLSNRTQKPWENTIIAAANQQEKIIAAIEELELLQKQQARNLRGIQSAVPSLLDVGVIKESNDKLEVKIEKLSNNIKEGEEQKAKIKEIISQIDPGLQNGLPNDVEELFNAIVKLTEPLAEPKFEEASEKKKEEPEDVEMADDSFPKIVATTE